MLTPWNAYSLKARIEFSNNRKNEFRSAVIASFLKHPNEPFTPSDEELAVLCGLPIRTTKRYLKYWKDKGIFTTSSKRYNHPIFGWCVQRTLDVNPVAVEIAQEHLRLYGKVL